MRNIVVLGMHRSGTSMVAGALGRAGIYIGEPEDLLVDQDDNPQGFWERKDVVELDDEILRDCGGEWYSPPEVGAEQGDFSPAVANILSKLPADKSWLLKDPRMALAWNAWQAALQSPVLVYVYRDPREVAVSLTRRNRFPLQFGLALWEYYNRAVLDILARDNDFVAVDFAEVKARPTEQIDRLLDQLVGFGVSLDPQQATDSGYEPSLNRSARADSLIDSADKLMTSGQRKLEKALLALCAENALGSVPEPDPSLSVRLRDMASAVAPLADAYETRIALQEAQALCQDRTVERDHSLRQLKQLEGSYDALVKAHDDEVLQHKQLYDQHQQLNAEHKQQGDAYTELDRKHEELQTEHAMLGQAYREVEEKAQHLFDVLTTAYRNILSYETSGLASITRVVVKAYKHLTRRRGVRTSYEDALVDAKAHFSEFDLDLPVRTPGKIDHLKSVFAYIRENPAASLRSFSFARLKRGLGVLWRSSPEDFDNWVSSRFPNREVQNLEFDPDSLDPELDTRELSFPEFDQPRVSIIVPVYNDYRVTMNCLVALLENTTDVSYEVILGDDCSTDLTRSIAERVKNLVVSRTTENARFLLNCNQAAEQARGEFLLFLNNDTAVCPGWLQPLVEVMDQRPAVGIVGPKLLFANGRLQEAGGIIWRDASGWNFGRMDDPDKPDYNYVKPVDYISGASLMIRASLWERLGGFDPRFVPAYYEDSDIAFAVRNLGYEVVYQPASQVFHFEGISNGTDLSSGVKQHQVTNQGVFREKWSEELDRFQFPNAEHVSWARDRSRERRTVLVIDHYVPHYDKDAGSRSTFMYVQLMCEMGYRVMFMGANFFPHAPYTETLQQMGVEVLVGESIARHLNRWLQDNAPYIDAIYLHRPHVAEQFLPLIAKMEPRPPVIFFGHDLHYLRAEREFALTAQAEHEREAASWKKREFEVFGQVDKVYYPSQVEVDKIRTERADVNARAIPLYTMNDAALPAYDFSASHDLMFVGGFNHPPNVDAVSWLVADIMPLVWERYPELCLHIVGSNPTEAVKALAGERVQLHGYVSDEALSALYRTVRLAVVPLRYGAGVKGKVLEAVQQNVPLVVTPIGAEGIPEADNVMTIADTAQAFAEGIMRVQEGDAETLQKLPHYSDWLRAHFSKQRAAEILVEDFGPPLRSPVESVSPASATENAVSSS